MRGGKSLNITFVMMIEEGVAREVMRNLYLKYNTGGDIVPICLLRGLATNIKLHSQLILFSA